MAFGNSVQAAHRKFLGTGASSPDASQYAATSRRVGIREKPRIQLRLLQDKCVDDARARCMLTLPMPQPMQCTFLARSTPPGCPQWTEISLIQIKGRHHTGHIPHRGQDTDMVAPPTVVIVVDDNAGFLKGVARLLAHNGIESRTLPPRRRCSRTARADGNLPAARHPPRRNFGDRAERRLAASGSKCPVIFMTANDAEATRNEAMDAGCIAYLRKPFARDVLMDGKAVA